MAQKLSDTLPTHIEYHSADLYYTYTMYNPADVRWDVLNDIMSLYYLHYYQIFGLNGLVGDWVSGEMGAMLTDVRHPVLRSMGVRPKALSTSAAQSKRVVICTHSL